MQTLITTGNHIIQNRERYHNYYQLGKRTMPYLRGTVAKYIKPRGATKYATDLALRSLQRQINKQKPEIQHWTSATTFTVPPNTFSTANFSPCETLANAVDRDERVLGDSWINKALEIRIRGDDTIYGFPGVMRLIVYVPKKAGTTITWANFGEIIDTNRCTVLHDEIVKPLMATTQGSTATTHSGIYNFVRKLRLGNRKSTFIGTTPEMNNVRVAVLTDGLSTLTSVQTFSINYKLTYCNK